MTSRRLNRASCIRLSPISIASENTELAEVSQGGGRRAIARPAVAVPTETGGSGLARPSRVLRRMESGEVHREALEIGERAVLQRALVRGAQDDAGRQIGRASGRDRGDSEG